MKVLFTKDVKHKLNKEYYVVLVQFEDTDEHYHHDKKNWIPKDEEVLSLVDMMMIRSPTFNKKMKMMLV